MKILYVTNGYPTPVNPEYCIFNKEQIEHVQLAGHETEVIFINAREKGRIEYLKALPKILKMARKADVIHCYHGLSFLAVSLVVFKMPVVVSFLNSLENEYSEMPKLVSKFLRRLTLFRLTKKIGVVFKGNIPIGFPYENLVRQISNGVNIDVFSPLDEDLAKIEIGLDPAKRYVLFVSSKHLNRPQKRYDLYSSVISSLKQKVGYEDIEELTLTNTERMAVPIYFNASSVHLLTSIFEGSPNSVRESLACNTPVVTTDVGNVKTILAGLESCSIIQNDNVEDFIQGLIRALNFDEVRECRDAIIKKKLTSDDTTRELITLYKEVISENTAKLNSV